MKINYSHKNVQYDKKFPIVVSLDVHKGNTFMYSVDISTGEILKDRNYQGNYKGVLKSLKKLGRKKDVSIIYEAGNYSFAPYRFFTKHGYHCKVIAPSSIPHRGKRKKTDREDAIENLNYHTSGLLRYVDVPTREDEDFRECLRYRYAQVWNITRVKQRINSTLKRAGVIYELTKSRWTKTYRKWLKTVEIPANTRMVLDFHLQDLDTLESRREMLDDQLDKVIEKSPKYKELYAVYSLLPGIGRVGALTLILEGRDLNRFPKGNSLMNYTGLVPGKWSSGSSDPALRITKAGNKFLRCAFVGAAKFYRDARFFFPEKKLRNLGTETKEFISHCQERLYSRYRHLKKKGKSANKAKVAVAREMCGFVWELITKVWPRIPNSERNIILGMV